MGHPGIWVLIGLKMFFENHLNRVCRRPHLGETYSDLEDYLFTLYHIMHYFHAKPLTETGWSDQIRVFYQCGSSGSGYSTWNLNTLKFI